MPKANPSLGHTIQLDRVHEAYEQAKLDPVDEAFFRESFKGNHKKSTTFTMPREAHKSGVKGSQRSKREKRKKKKRYFK
jgi:hypothetical protein